ncbi:FUSC family protein [Acidisphaera sp. L21]|uniref:FUSC family protein n=1 Tax=Acidisphaera sp. L21 TaxID=1641851 RepID=UPI00131AC4C9|nr:FUSC family protein [Acidisphaera sp. L21]
MRLLATTPEANLKRLPIAFDLRAISLAEGTRAALSIAFIVAADQWLHWPPLLEAALAALLTCLSDSGGPIRRRLPALVSFMLLGAAITAGFGPLRGLGIVASVPIACLGIFALSFARVWGQAAMQAGNLLVVVLVLALDEPRPFAESALLAAVFAAGCAWAILLTMVIWRIHPFRPARHALSDAYRATARLVADLLGMVQGNADVAAWEAHARGHRRAVRDTIERARTAVQDTVRVRGQASQRAMQALLRIEAVDQLFGATIALSDLLEADRDPAVQATAIKLLRLLRPALIVIAEAIAADDPGKGGRRAPVQRLGRIGPALDAMQAATAETPALAGIADAIVERLRIATTLTAPPGWAPGSLPDPIPAGGMWDRVVTPVRANLQWQSAAFRHALRAAVVAGPALAFTLSTTGHYQHWLIITLVLTMQPFYALTWQRALERIGGTVLGGLLAAVIALVCTDPLAIAAALFPLAIIAFTVRSVNYGAFISLLTPLVVLLTEFSRPGTGELLIAGYRALYTVAGGALAVLGCLLLWPSWEPDRMKQELRTTILAHAAFAAAELSLLLGDGDAATVDRARRAAGVASNNLETSISRALNEPRGNQREDLQSAMVVDAALRRMAGRLSALQLDPHHADGIGPEALRSWRDWIGTALKALADGAAVPGARPAGRAPDALARIARQIELLDGTAAVAA